jgi:RimJ/RimL family protein N-acetyltransferase
MIELNLAGSAGAVRPLFQEAVPDGPRLFSALNGYHPAIALADAADDPRWCVLRSGWFGRTFIGGEIEPRVLGLAVQHLCQTGHVLLDLGDPRSAHYPAGATGIEPRIEFYDRPPEDRSLDRWIGPIPGHLRVRPVTHETFHACAMQHQCLSVFGTVSRYLERSVGFLLLEGTRLLSEAHAIFWGDTLVEIGVHTAEGYRGLGYATRVSAHLIRACEQRGYATYWGCHVDNLASAAVARKLGYGVETNYTLAYYPAA